MNLEDLREHMDNRFDRIEDKMDVIGDRSVANETSIIWIRGHLRVSITILLTVCGFLAAAYFGSIRL